MILIRVTKVLRRIDCSSTAFRSNTGILIKKKQNVKSKYLRGPSTYHLRRKKFKTLYKTLL